MWPMTASVVGVLLAAAPGGGSIAIIDVDSPPAMMGLAGQVTQTVVREAQAQKKRVLTPDEVRKSLGNKSYDELVKCADKAACAANLAAVLGVERVVTGVLGRDEKNYKVKLWMFDVSKTALIAEVDRSILIASRRFQRDVTEAVPDFLKGKTEAKGTLVITATAKACSVTLNGEFAGMTPLTATLKPGRYEVRVDKKAYLSVVRLVDVEANQSRTEEVRMLVVPGMTPEDEKVPELAKRAETQEAPAMSATRPLAFVTGGLALVTAGFALGFGVSSQSLERTLTSGYDAPTDTYAGSRQMALDARDQAVAANVLWASAGVLTAATVLFVVIDAVSGKPAGPTVAPAVGQDGAGVVVGGTF